MDLSILSPRVATLGADSKEKMHRVRGALHAAIEITRRITEELHPTLLNNVALFAALRWPLRQVCALGGELNIEHRPYGGIVVAVSAPIANDTPPAHWFRSG